MEDDKRLDLCLGLVVRGSSSKSKEKSNSSIGASSNNPDRTTKIMSDFRNFLNGGIPQQPQGGYFNNFPSSAITDHTSGEQNLEGEKGPVLGDKRKNIYEEMNNNKKEREVQNSDLLDNAETSHISITTDEGSTADNEDVAESGAETSRLFPNMEDANPQTSSEASKEFPGKVSSSLPPFSLQSASSLNLPCSINIPMMFGYPHGQLPSLDKDSPWGMVTQSPLLHPYSGRPLPASATTYGLSEGKHPTTIEGFSSEAADDNAKSSFPSEYPSIRPGMATGLKFGGAGSSPNLPWVSTIGPSGRSISGVTYRFSPNQIKIVCACHGLHMSPQDFIHHASDEPHSVADSTAIANNATASAKS